MLAIFGERVLRSRPQFPSGDASHLAAAIVRGARAWQPRGDAARRAARTGRLVTAGAWTEAALALAEQELETWHLSRLEHDGDEWVCTLSRYPSLPEAFDEVAFGRDRLLPLAILDALSDVRRRSSAVAADTRGTEAVHRVGAWTDDVFR